MVIKKHQLLTLFFVLLTCSAVYSPGIFGPFVFDDQGSILDNSLIHISELNIENILSSAKSGTAGPLKRPIPMISFALNHFFANGLYAPAFKITNIFIHALNSFLVFFLCLRLIDAANNSTQYKYTSPFYFSLFIASLWVLHPINLTSVLYIVQRMTSLAAFFSFISIILYLKGRHTLTHQHSCFFYTTFFILSFACWGLALLSKESAASLPLLILLIELLLFKNPILLTLPQKFSTLTKTLLATALIYCFYSIFLYAQSGYHSRSFTMYERLLTETRVITSYLYMIALPKINSFSLFHDEKSISTSLTSPISTLTSIFFLIIIIFVSIRIRNKNPLFTFGITWFFAGHIIESSVIALEIMHEHRNYIPSVGIILSLYSLIPSKLINSKTTKALLLLPILFVGSTTFLKADQWGSLQSLSYFESIHNPLSPATQLLHSNVNLKAGNSDIAESAIKKAILLDTREASYPLHYQLLLSKLKRPIPVEIQLETLKRLHLKQITPSTKGILLIISNCLINKSCLSLLPNYMQWVLTLTQDSPDDAFYHYLQGKGHQAENNHVKALNSFQKAHEKDNHYLQPLFRIISILIANHQFEAAHKVLSIAEAKNEEAKIPLNNTLKKLRSDLNSLRKKVEKRELTH